MRQPRPEVFASLIQSSLGGDFEAVIKLANNELWHYWRDNSKDGQPWAATQRITAAAAYAGSLIQSRGSDGKAGNFEVVVPLMQNNATVQLTYFRHYNADSPTGPWQLGASITADTDQVVGPGCIIQSSFGPDNFEVIVPIKGAAGHAVLQHFWRGDPSNLTQPWQRGLQVTQPGDVVTGPGCIIQSTRGVSPDKGGGDIQIVVPIKGPGGWPQLRHISRAGATGPWVTNPTPITAPSDVVVGGAVIIESDFRDEHGQGNFEVLVGVRMPAGHIEIRHLWHDTSNSPAWTPVGPLTASAGDSEDPFAAAGVALIQSDYSKGGPHGNFEVLLAQCERSLGCYLRNNASSAPQWASGGTSQIADFDPLQDEKYPTHDQSRLPEEPHVNHYNNVGKICQLIGEYDLEGWSSMALPSHASTGPAVVVGDFPSAGRATRSALITAWPNAGDGRLQLSASTDELVAPTDGDVKYIPAPQTGDFTDAPPALAGLNGEVFLAWKGLGNQLLNVAALQYTADRGWGSPAIGSHLSITATTDAGPALAVYRGQLVLAWKGVGNNFLNIAFWQPGSPAFRTLPHFNEVTTAQPALVSHNDRLLIAWAGGGNHVNVAELPAGSSSLTGKVTLPGTLVGPALASFQGRLFLAVTEIVGQAPALSFQMKIMASDDNGQTFPGPPPRTPQTSAARGDLAASQDRLLWAWTQEPQQQVNVGRYVPPAGRPPATPFGAAFNRTETNAKIQGTDLGNQFMHGNRMCFLFGDTAFTDPKAIFNLDTIAFADLSDFNPATGLKLTFNPQPPVIAGMRDSQKVYSVPLDGITINGTMYLFYSLDSVQLSPGPPPYQSFGHTDVVKSVDNGFNFTHLYQFSKEHFLNVSIAQVHGADLGLPDFGDALAVWGSGIYHSSEPYLAAMPLSSIETGQSKRYFAGMSGGAPLWVNDEGTAAPLFQDPTLAELSVRFNPYLNVWMMTYTSYTVHGVCLRLSATPWGPWTTPLRLQHQWWTPPDVANKPSDYIHAPNNLPGLVRQNWMYDVSMQVPGNSPNVGGIPYSPAIIEPLIQGQTFKPQQGQAGASTTIFYTMSTWSPYTSLLMRADLNVADPPPLVLPPNNARTAGTPDQIIAALAALNITFSVARQDLLDWLNDPQNTEYPKLAQALLALLAGKRLKQPVNIDVINWYYEDHDHLALPPPLGKTNTDVNMYALPFAVLEASNDNNGTNWTSFQQLLAVTTTNSSNQPEEPR